MPREVEIKFKAMPPQTTLFECNICGAAVSNQMLHTNEHLSFTRLIKTLEARYQQFIDYTAVTNSAMLGVLKKLNLPVEYDDSPEITGD